MDQQTARTSAPVLPQGALGLIRADLFCENCSYNLHGQIVTRDSGTGLLVCRCPECGKFAAAGVATDAGRPWLRRLGTGLLVLWVLTVVWLLGTAVVGLGALTYGALWEGLRPTFWVTYGGLQGRLYWLHIGFGLGGLALGLVLGGFLVVFLHHWKRWQYWLGLLVPLIAGAVAVAIWASERGMGSSVAAFESSDYEIQHLQSLRDMYSRHVSAQGSNVDISSRERLRDVDERLRQRRELLALAYQEYEAYNKPVLLGLLHSLAQLLGLALGIWLGRPVVRGVLRVVLPPRSLQMFAPLWWVDQKRLPQTQPPVTRA